MNIYVDLNRVVLSRKFLFFLLLVANYIDIRKLHSKTTIWKGVADYRPVK